MIEEKGKLQRGIDLEKEIENLNIDIKELKNNKVLIHPNRNTATISIKYDDLIKFIKHCGNEYIEI